MFELPTVLWEDRHCEVTLVLDGVRYHLPLPVPASTLDADGVAEVVAKTIKAHKGNN